MMYDEIFELAKSLMVIYDRMYEELEPLVLDIINNNICDIKLIEHTLDLLFGVPTEKGEKLYRKLCEYYSHINKEYADDYLDFYDEMYGEEKVLKKN